MTTGTVLPKRHRLRKDDAKGALAAALVRLVRDHGGVGTVADAAGCCDRTIRNAMAMDGLPELHTAINLLLLDPTALDELLAPLGVRIVPADTAGVCWRGLLAEMAGTVADLAAALADDRVDHRERAQLLERARPLVQILAGQIAQHDRERAAA